MKCARLIISGYVGLGACTGSIEDPSLEGNEVVGPGKVVDEEKILPGMFVAPERELAATLGIRRLSTREYDNTVATLLGDTSRAGSHSLPADIHNLFDDYLQQEGQIGDTLVSSVESVASTIAYNFVADQARRDRVVGCKPTDAGCLESFVSRFGRLVLRHPLSDEDRQIYLDIPRAAQTTDDFYKSVELIVGAFLQDPEFIHRFEIGTPVPGVPGLFKLGRFELLGRLSYLLWSDMPSAELLDQVERQDGLSTPENVIAVASKMLADPRALDQVARFHSMWLGYDNISHGLADPMKDETRALLGKVILEDHRPWQDIFRADQTLVTYELARNYGLPIPTGLTKGSKPKWVPYNGVRRGLFSHGTLLSLGNKFGDTSPTVRGKEIRRRMFCEPVREPDPELLAKFKADTNRPPPGSGSLCKWDRYKANRDISPGCAACHNTLDLVGFGLENFDALGRYRTTQYWTRGTDGTAVSALPGSAGAELCQIKADGVVDGVAFSGPPGLGEALTGSAAFLGCTLRQLYQFGMEVGELGDADQRVIGRFQKYVGVGDFRLDDVLLKLVSSPAFAHRRMDLGI